MLVSKLLTELNISYSRLLLYNNFLDTAITNQDQDLEEETYLKIIALYKNKHIQDQLDNLELNNSLKNYGGYLVDNQFKFIGKIKWYYNKKNKGEYGFVNHIKLGDVYFRGNTVKDINPHNLRENEEVIFTISKKSFIQRALIRNKIKATELIPITSETDISFLTYTAVFNSNTKSINRLTEIFDSDDFNLKPLIKLNIQQLLNEYFDSTTISLGQVETIISLINQFDIQFHKDWEEKIEKSLNREEKFKLFFYTDYKLPFYAIKEQLISHVVSNPSNSQYLLNKLNQQDLDYTLKEVFNVLVSQQTQNNYQSLLDFVKSNDVKIDQTQLNQDQILVLWLNNQIEEFPLDTVYNYLFKIKAQLDSTIRRRDIYLLDQKISKVLDKITEQQYFNLLSKIYNQQDKIDDLKLINQITFLLEHTKDTTLRNKAINTIENKATDYIKLQLFLNGYLDVINYYDVVIYTGLLSASDQKLFFKKVLMLIETKVLDLDLDDLNKITTYNYRDNLYAKEIDGVGLDFTLSIILKIATDLSNNQITARHTIFDIIANQIKTPKDLLVIDGFFHKCEGRTVTKEFTVKKESETEPSYYKQKTDKTPKFATFCDGRKAINRNTGEPVLSKKGNFEFWWCENVPCFETCRKPVDSNNWENYSLQDVLRILNISYSETQYEIVLSVINKVNRYLEHLKCKSCSNILRPNGRSNYGFYGVSMFSCTNKNCENPDKDVYLSHCLNGQCEDLIDSRETVKCRPSTLEKPDNCGWYICNNCYACCDSDKLKARKDRLERTGQNYLCHTKGHRNLGIICCTECGTETNRRKFNSELYTTQLEWFKSKIGTESIVNSNQREDGKWWFRWSRGNLTYERFYNALLSLKNNGFQVPNIETGEDIQFIAEPLSDDYVFECPNCDHLIDLSDKEMFDYARKKAIEQFHTTIYPNTQV